MPTHRLTGPTSPYTRTHTLLRRARLAIMPPPREMVRKILPFASCFHVVPAKLVTPEPAYAAGNLGVEVPVNTNSRAFGHIASRSSTVRLMTDVPLTTTMSHVGRISFC